MKKFLLYSISILSIISMIAGILLKRGDLIFVGLYIHFVEAALMSLDEYKPSKNMVIKTIFYPSVFLILTTIIVYQVIIG